MSKSQNVETATKMTDSPESVVRKFFATWADPKPDQLISFFNDDAVFIDGPRGVHRGVDAIKSEFEAMQAMGLGSVMIDVKSLVTDGRTVMMERVDNFHFDGKPISLEVMAAVEIDADQAVA
jgi:limonene-1,2-epoxide hydrolase